ncbi:MAG: hypothetical protein NZP74_11200 [Anaerolineales bacterium]|nr:hypothetical protein [Anaerolineales bacterium]MDW8278132.1 hypothetical protein [Anaerolineales bacterium]
MSTSDSQELEVPQVVNLSNVTVGEVKAELVRATQSVIHKLEAEEADAGQVIIGAAASGQFNGRRAIIGAVQSQQADLRYVHVGGVRAGTVSLNGKTALVLADSVSAPQTNALLVAGANIQAETVRAGILIGRQVNGSVQTLFDARSALLAGLAGGVVAGLILLAARRLFHSKK